jgi:conserved oligomeric Golgi complex subunit 3
MHLLYTRFTTVAGQLAPLFGEFERRAHSHPEELGALLSECHGVYFGARKNLLVSRLTEQIRGLDPTRTELGVGTPHILSHLTTCHERVIDTRRV